LKRKKQKQHKKHAGPDGEGQPAPERAERRSKPLLGDEARYLEIVLAVVAFAAVLMRAIYLKADPPVDLSWSQALFTDGARAIDGARNRIMYGEWTADKVSPVLLYYPISNLLAYVIYRIGGIGLAQANLTGVLPALGTLALVWHFMRKWSGKVAALVALGVFTLPYVYVIYSRTPLLESLQIFLLVGAFVMLIRGRPAGFALAGLLVGAAGFMVKLHALHFAVVALAYLFFAARTREDSSTKPYRLGLFFVAGLAAAFVIWLAGVYSVDPAAVSRYFRSNILNTQTGEYTGGSIAGVIGTRIKQFFHVGSGMDMFFRKSPVLSILAAAGLISALSGFAPGNRSQRSWEMLAALWFAGLATALSLLSYRPLRYFIPLIPAMGFLATSVILRLINGEPLLHPNKPKWFFVALFIWLTWVFIHVQHDIIFKVIQPYLGGAMPASEQALARYDFSILQQLLVMGGASAAIMFLFGRNLREASWKFGRATRKNLVLAAVAALVLLNLGMFGDYCADRKYTIMTMAESLERVTSRGGFVVGDCATTLSLETDFRTLPSYGEVIRQGDKARFEQYPITHFLIRFPTLHEYLTDNYPAFPTTYVPVNRYSLCGRDATVIRFEQWPGYPKTYSPTRFEEGMFRLSRGHVNNALTEFEAFLESEPESYEAMFGSAVCLAVMDRQDEARAKLEAAIEIAPSGALEYHVYRDLLSTLLSGEAAGR
jgi:4-amino-4-deoxy-L-arabinose transferase-like glycosyltransferase